MIKKIYTILAALIISGFAYKANAQQDPMYSQYMVNLLPTNPAYAGTSGLLNATAISRHQWVGFDGAPTTQVLLLNSPILTENIGIGATVLRDQAGPVVQTLAFADFAYNFKISPKLRMSLGLKAGANVQKPDLTGLELDDPNDAAFQTTQNVDIMPNVGFGMYVYNQRFFAGFSTPKIIKNDFESIQNVREGGEERHFFLTAGYVFDLNEEWKMKPTFMLKMVKGAPLSGDLTASFIWHDKLWLGGMYRMHDAVGAMVQYQLTHQFRAGYAYDYPITEMRGYNGGTHEILLSYDLVFKDKKIVTPRYF